MLWFRKSFIVKHKNDYWVFFDTKETKEGEPWSAGGPYGSFEDADNRQKEVYMMGHIGAKKYKVGDIIIFLPVPGFGLEGKVLKISDRVKCRILKSNVKKISAGDIAWFYPADVKKK